MYMHCPSGDFLTFVFKLKLNYMYVEFYVFNCSICSIVGLLFVNMGARRGKGATCPSLPEFEK